MLPRGKKLQTYIQVALKQLRRTGSRLDGFKPSSYCGDVGEVVRNLLQRLGEMHDLRKKLVDLALKWERSFGNAPHITAALSELDAARLVGCSLDKYAECMRGATSVRRGHDFEFNGRRYQVKANRPSGKPGSAVTLVPKAKNFDWDVLIWILYDKEYKIQEAWSWEAALYQKAFEFEKRLRPAHYQRGQRLPVPRNR